MGFFSRKTKKGQLTLEYLVLSVVVLAVLAISITTLMEINKSARKAMENIIFRKSALDLHATIEEVCALGGGNSQKILLKTKISVEKEGQNLIFEDEGKKMGLELICPYEIEAKNPLSGFVTVENEKQFYGNIIKIKSI